MVPRDSKSDLPLFRAKMVDLQNASDVEAGLNLGIDDIWEEFLWIRYAPPYDIIRCVSISVPSLNSKISEGRKEFISMNLIFEHSKFMRLLLDFAGKGQSKINYDPGNIGV